MFIVKGHFIRHVCISSEVIVHFRTVLLQESILVVDDEPEKEQDA